jgi:hypothetical protein
MSSLAVIAPNHFPGSLGRLFHWIFCLPRLQDTLPPYLLVWTYASEYSGLRVRET